MTKKLVIGSAALVMGIAGWRLQGWQSTASRPQAAVAQVQSVAAGPVKAFVIGHEYRQDDWPSIAAAPDGSVWAAWLSFVGNRDDVGLRRWHDGKWSNLLWVPATSGDSWMPQVFADRQNRVWAVWSQQVAGNWDLYARRFDPVRQEWSKLERLTEDPLPDIHPQLWSDGKGSAALVWQAFRTRADGAGAKSNIFLRRFDGEQWQPEIRVTDRPANDWEPAVAADSRGTVYVVYDSYKNGNYDVFLTRVRDGAVEAETPLAVSPRLEVHASVAVDTADRPWVAWEVGPANWGKDQGYVVRGWSGGALLGGARDVRVRCFQDGTWKQPAAPLAGVFTDGDPQQPRLVSDGRGSIWLAAKVRTPAVYNPMRRKPDGYQPEEQDGIWEYRLTHLDGAAWSKAVVLPASACRMSTRIQGCLGADGRLWLAWPTDGRKLGARYAKPKRQEIRAGVVSAAAAPGTIGFEAPPEEVVDMLPVPPQATEAGDIRRIRGYRADVDGRASRIVRGDFHRHTELSADIGGSIDGSLEDFYRYMIDVAGMDFGASTDHMAGGWPYWQWYTQKMTDLHHVPGAYVAIFGYERSASYPFGHRNIFFAERSAWRITPFFTREGTKQDEPLGTTSLVGNDTELLHEEMRGANTLSIPHTSSNSMGTDWRGLDDKFDPVAEIFQGARTSSEQVGAPLVADPNRDAAHIKINGYQPEGMLSEAWAKGYRLGVIASSDHFSTHISYALVYTDDFTRQGILDAIRKRHTYGATDNIILEVSAGRYFMGDEFQTDRPLPIHVRARGTAPVARIDVIRDSRVVYTTAPGRGAVDFDYTDMNAGGNRHYYYVRLLQENGMMAWSSPLFVNYGPGKK